MNEIVEVAKGRKLRIRFAKPGDQSYVARTFVASVAEAHKLDTQAVRALNAQVDRLFDDPVTRILVAVEPADDKRIVGFIVFARRTLLYVAVRNTDRCEGVATALVHAAGLGVNGSPVLYVFEGPSALWALAKRPDAVRVSLEEHLS